MLSAPPLQAVARTRDGNPGPWREMAHGDGYDLLAKEKCLQKLKLPGMSLPAPIPGNRSRRGPNTMNTKKHTLMTGIGLVFFFLILLAMLLPQNATAQGEAYDWIVGPADVDLGKNLAEISLGEDYAFLDGDDTKRLMDAMGNPPSDGEVGLIIPRIDPPPWFLVFEYFPVGYIRDDEKDQLDGNAILKSIKKGNAEANKLRQDKGFPPLEILGWYEEPHYDPLSHNLVWTLLARESEGYQTVNYNVRLLGRKGYMSVVLVTDPETLDSSRMELSDLLAGFSYKTGSRYAEFVQGDRVAQIGLAALVAGGAATVAAKTGILKALVKSGKLIVLAVVGVLGAFWRKLRGLFGHEQ